MSDLKLIDAIATWKWRLDDFSGLNFPLVLGLMFHLYL
jgi:hypothetical protein